MIGKPEYKMIFVRRSFYYTHVSTKLDTNKMKQSMKPFAEELVAYVFNPVRLNCIATRLGMDLEDLLDTF